MNNPFERAKGLSQDGIFINFYGPISQAILVELGEILKQKLKNEHISPQTIQNLFALLVEQTQSVLSYLHQNAQLASTSKRVPPKNAIISIGYKDKNYFVITQNKINNTDVVPIQEKLVAIQEMSEEELKTLYKTKLKENICEEQRKNDLRLIEMARKSAATIEFKFQQIDTDYSFFSLKSMVKN